MKNFLHYSLLTVLLLCLLPAMAQDPQPWSSSNTIMHHDDLLAGEQAQAYTLQTKTAKAMLDASPYRSPAGNPVIEGNTIAFPSPEGTMESYRVVRTRVLSEKLAAKFPGIRSYQGISLTHPGRRIYFSMDKTGFHGMIRDGSASWYLNPVSQGSETIYLAAKSQIDPHSYQCLTEGKVVAEAREKANTQLRSFNDTSLRTFRLALACTGEYSEYHINQANVASGTEVEQKEAVLSAMNTTMTRVNGIFENDLALTMQIIDNNDQIIFLDAQNDGLTNNDGSALLNEIQEVIDNAIGFNNYDIGHVFSTGGGGIAQVASPCTNNKARGVTGLSVPEGDLFDIDFVAHEMGHQLGATHTFNNSCGENRTPITAVEPGSGSTIMAYAGICPPNVAGQSGDYFHAISVQQIWQNITQGNSTCASVTALSNSAPVLTPPSNYKIPAGTPFVLEATATDADNDALTFCWEQQDNEISLQPPLNTATDGPVFRSRTPSTSPNRYFPNPQSLLNNDLSPEWEILPTVSRDLNFSILVRDNNQAGGQSARGDVNIEVFDTGSPFRVTSQSTSTTLQAGEPETITWDVAGTNAEPFNTTLVDILLVVNGDFDNPVIIEEDTPNDGNQEVVMPTDVASNNARIMVRAANNIFFALNQGNISLQQSAFALDLTSLEYSVCQPNALEIPFTYLTYGGFNETTTFSAANVSAGLAIDFSSATASSNNTNITATVSNTDQAATGENTFTLVATAAGGTVREYPITINVFNGTFEVPTLVSPSNNSSDILLDSELTWQGVPNTTGYLVEVSTDAGFSNIIESATTENVNYLPEQLSENTGYFWRVSPVNECGQGSPSPAFSFTTIAVNSVLFENNTVVTIPPTGPQTVTSTVIVDREGDLNKLRVGVNIDHTYIQDLTLTLTSPNGTTITLAQNPCGDNSDIDVIFDDEGETLTCGANPAISGVVAPKDDLAVFKGTPIMGPWTLTVIDDFDLDGGAINSFSLEVFVNGAFKNDEDGDGVFDENDECPNTPAGDKVDIKGCSVFSLAASNYLIRTEGESCRNTGDGSITITTAQELQYTANLTGNNGKQTLNFSNEVTFENITAGTYQLCFTVAGEPDYEQCFTIEIVQPEPLSVLSRPDLASRRVTLDLEGGELYFIDLNGTTTTTTEQRIELNLSEGINTLAVSTTKPCQGVYKEEFIVGSGLSIFPNPVGNTLNISTTERGASLSISVYSITGKLALSRDLTTDGSGRVDTSVAELPAGVYLLNVVGETTRKTIKLIKQ
ncbi:reprolysin-like metallopeptidase [Robertkochia sediminum]|uniref:reprolysin-like metallopeptidase n=1 Tax=Robertkochia sediminum TaxID=2785326 RepID=UPI0019339BE3|nr:zinc-dependent metalloprotease family protein [Robertkochia sediminum]MBL7472335.1 proprotein convertase P-domain-containing protein [Robertkochia sediminum]